MRLKKYKLNYTQRVKISYLILIKISRRLKGFPQIGNNKKVKIMNLCKSV